ncbi:hypothetical protein Acr_00g0097250 [Actinidia rufa]|uniref:Uncharacterized protein n=1 Tax=Actinidia rufa TaxID=165716 RepID=A0A7J0D6P0_9ERIC|nr:hypothetical protein Acr_00g0001700 [Actinidia rufa]GFS45650.1 hypothetical protein Acr_00g0097250 [Actinidia rufa]
MRVLLGLDQILFLLRLGFAFQLTALFALTHEFDLRSPPSKRNSLAIRTEEKEQAMCPRLKGLWVKFQLGSQRRVTAFWLDYEGPNESESLAKPYRGEREESEREGTGPVLVIEYPTERVYATMRVKQSQVKGFVPQTALKLITFLGEGDTKQDSKTENDRGSRFYSRFYLS